MQRQWTSDISKVLSFYYDNKVFAVYLHKNILYWSFSSWHLSGCLAKKTCSCSIVQVAVDGSCSGMLYS